ncbi:winged helix-turn-helix transcriptional regulator [Roseateles sp. NT4]|uniref:winged helix-turn-helix transcriptional regulator n=1 Tax=Roseateles sp. NT4 TaxID=3453715 RepID=UPI003F715872
MSSALTGRWTFLVLETLYLAGGTSRFRELQRKVGGISNRELARCLTNLIQASLIKRVAGAQSDGPVAYLIAPEVEQLLQKLEEVARWSKSTRSASLGSKTEKSASWLDPISARQWSESALPRAANVELPSPS